MSTVARHHILHPPFEFSTAMIADLALWSLRPSVLAHEARTPTARTQRPKTIGLSSCQISVASKTRFLDRDPRLPVLRLDCAA